MSNEDLCLHFEAKLVPDPRTKIKKRLIAAICDLKQPCIFSAKNGKTFHPPLSLNDIPVARVSHSKHLILYLDKNLFHKTYCGIYQGRA